MTDEVLSVRYSPNGKLLAVSLLDSTVKVFYQDTLKFFLSLYGHKVCRPTLLLLEPVNSCPFTAPCPIDGHILRLETDCDLLRGQKRQNMGP
jgi:hypothetical protein